MSAPYDFRRITPSVYGDKRPVEGEVVAILHVMFHERGLELIQTKSRTVKMNEIHRVRAIAFFEITKSGLIVMGDEVTIEGKKLGTLAGYDVTHMPNHINVVVKTETLNEPVLRAGDKVRFA